MSYLHFFVLSKLQNLIQILIREVKKSKVLGFQNFLHFLKEEIKAIIFDIFYAPKYF